MAGWRHSLSSPSPPHPPILHPWGAEGACTCPGEGGAAERATLTLTPVPAMPVGFASVRRAAVFPPQLTVLPAQGHLQNSLAWPARVQLDTGMAGDKNASSNRLEMIGRSEGTCAGYPRNQFSYGVYKQGFTQNKEAWRLHCSALATKLRPSGTMGLRGALLLQLSSLPHYAALQGLRKLPLQLLSQPGL